MIFNNNNDVSKILVISEDYGTLRLALNKAKESNESNPTNRAPEINWLIEGNEVGQ